MLFSHVSGSESAAHLGLHPHLPHNAGPQTGREGAMELVPDLPPRVGVRRHPHPHAGDQDGGPLQAGARRAERLPGPASARLVPDRHPAPAGLLPHPLCQTGEAGRREAHLRLHPPVDRPAGGAGRTGPQHLPRETGGLGERGRGEV